MTVGIIVSSSNPNPPPGWLVCDGSAYDGQLAYPELYQIIGNTYGPGDPAHGAQSFNVPNLCGRFIRGLDARTDPNQCRDPDAASRTPLKPGDPGATVGSTQFSQLGPHSHTVSGMTSPDAPQQYRHSAQAYLPDNQQDSWGQTDPMPANTGGNGDLAEVLPKHMVVLFLIQAKP